MRGQITRYQALNTEPSSFSLLSVPSLNFDSLANLWSLYLKCPTFSIVV